MLSDPGTLLRAPSEPAAAVTRQAVSFASAGQRCDGWLWRPASSDPLPCLVMAHGLGGIRSAVLPQIAQRFAAAGIAALVFDYRHLGTSEGEPRGLIDIGKQRQDYRAAIAYARQLPGIDPRRIAAWGTSFSGGHVLTVAADDARLAAAVIQNPFVDGRAVVTATLRSAGRARTALLAWQGLRDETRRLLGRPPHRMTTPDAAPGYGSILPPDPVGFEPAIPARLVLRLGADRPALRAPWVGCPLLVCVCDQDVLAPPRPAVRVARQAPRGELRRYPIGHFDLFGGQWLEEVVGDQLAFLRRTLLDP
jgi:alpha/beta superfamily hydrolase